MAGSWNPAGARKSAERLRDRLGEAFLGLREDRGEVTVWVDRAVWKEALRFLKEEEGFSFFSDLTAVDYLDRRMRFDVVVNLLDRERKTPIRVKTPVGEEDPAVATLTGLWPAASWYEREVWDLFGIRFEGHPDLRRLLLPPDYAGHPLRKDYAVTGPPTSLYR